jgi:hypothetical protein
MLTLLALAWLQDPYVRVHDALVRPLARPGASSPADDGRAHAYPPPCDARAAGRHGESLAGAGTLNPIAFANPATVFAGGPNGARVAFVAQVSGAARNQGVFVHDGTNLTPIAMGSGALGGGGSTGTAGDPAPLGGNFSGFFTGTVFAPAVNANGDVLFLADVFGGSAPRGLFLYRAASADIVTVAAVGDASPLGGVLARVGPGSLSDTGTVVFLASEASLGASDVLRWQGGVLSKVAAAGDVSPHGSPYQYLGAESFGFADGSDIPVGPVPDVDAAGNIVFRAITIDGRRGIVHNDEFDTQVWLVRDLEAAPGGGTFFDLQGATLNARGEIAFFADVRLSPSSFTAGWFAGTSGNWRAALRFGDALGGGTANGLAFSRNPMSPLDDEGNLLAWVDVLLAGGGSREHLVVCSPDGAKTVVARRNDVTPLGGTYTSFDAWPSLLPAGTPGRGAFGSGLGGLPGVFSAHFLFEACPAARATVRNGSGANPTCFTADAPVLGGAWSATVDASAHAGATLTWIVGHALSVPGTPTPLGELLLDPGSPRVLLSRVPGAGLVVHSASVPADLALLGQGATLQALLVGGGAALCNAVDVVLGY